MKVKGSRFIATAAPVTDAAAAAELFARVRKEFHDARHVCTAYRLGRTADAFRWDDDGEPTGSAGRPILQQIDAVGLTDVAVAVTRYFGGTKLGVGGLVRAYGGAAAAVLERAEKRTVVVTRRVVVEHPYECSNAVQSCLAARGLQPTESTYGASVRLVFDVPEDEVESFTRELTDRTADRATIDVDVQPSDP